MLQSKMAKGVWYNRLAKTILRRMIHVINYDLPVWYTIVPQGEFHIWTGGSSRKAKLSREAGRFSLCVQQETPPYKYVSAEGPVVDIEPIQLERDLRPLVYRYLGVEEGDNFIEGLGGDSAGTGDILIRMKPERWLSEDYSKST
jgi:hypothetical protein